MRWIQVNSITPKANEPYLAYGDQLNSHMPGMALVKWNRHGDEWVDYDDIEHYYRDYEIDYVLPLKSIEPPTDRKLEVQWKESFAQVPMYLQDAEDSHECQFIYKPPTSPITALNAKICKDIFTVKLSRPMSRNEEIEV